MKNLKRLLAVVMIMAFLVCSLPFVSVSAATQELSLGVPFEVSVGEDGTTVQFTPQKDGKYKFYSTGEYDTYATLFDGSSMDGVHISNDDSKDYNFGIIEYLEAGVTYTLEISSFDARGDVIITFPVIVEEAVSVVSLEIKKQPTNTTVVEGYEYESMDLTGVELEVTLSNGDTDIWVYSDDCEYYFPNYPELEIDYYFTSDETNNVNMVVFQCENFETDFNFTVVENLVESIELVSDTVLEFIENKGGYMDSYYDYETDSYIYYYYYSVDAPTNAVIQINYKDGTSKTANVEDVVDGYEIEWNSRQVSKVWTLGEDNALFVTYMGRECTIPVVIKESPVASIELVSASEKRVVENYGGYMAEYFDDELGEYVEYYHYYCDEGYFSDAIIRINYNDGTYITANLGEWVDDERIEIDSNQPWELGENQVTVFYAGKETTMDITVIENPVESIEYSCETPIEYYEHTNGYVSSNDDGDYYHYDYSIPRDAIITVNYKDGTSEEFKYYYYTEFDCEVYDEQEEEPWTIGGDNFITIEYLGAKVNVPVTISPCPIDKVTVNSAPTKKYVFGDYDTGRLVDGKYYVFANDLTGLSFTVEYKDGTTKTLTDADVDMDSGEIDGYYYDISTPIVTGPSSCEVVLCYKGAEIKYNVDVIEPYVKSIEVLKAPDKDTYSKSCEPDYTGMIVKVNYKDGTSAQATANEDTMTYKLMNMTVIRPVCELKVGKDTVLIYSTTDSYDRAYVQLSCAGVRAKCDLLKWAERITVNGTPAIENFTETGDSMVVTLSFKGGITEKLTFDVLDYHRTPDAVRACAMTEKGVVKYNIVKSYDKDGKCLGYNVMLYNFNASVFVPVSDGLKGDADGDGKVTILDASLIQLHRAQMATIDEENLKLADTDGDSKVTVLDATRIQLFLAQMLPEL